MDHDTFNSRLRELGELLVHASELVQQVEMLTAECDIRACLIAALVQAHGGQIPGAIWDACHAGNSWAVQYGGTRDAMWVAVKPTPDEPPA